MRRRGKKEIEEGKKEGIEGDKIRKPKKTEKFGD